MVSYTDNQRNAINTINQNLQIIACAGSGKTQVISARIVEILKNPDIKPSNVVAFTFTDRAAAELKDRIYKLHQEAGGDIVGMADMFVGTIHGYCLNLLQSEPVYEFLKYSILSEIQQKLLIDRYSSESGLTFTPLINGGTLTRWIDSKLYQQVIAILQEDIVDSDAIPQGVRDAVLKYANLIKDKKYLDYSTIISNAVLEIEINYELQNKLASQIKYLVVDEYQDVNPLQEKLIHKLT